MPLTILGFAPFLPSSPATLANNSLCLQTATLPSLPLPHVHLRRLWVMMTRHHVPSPASQLEPTFFFFFPSLKNVSPSISLRGDIIIGLALLCVRLGFQHLTASPQTVTFFHSNSVKDASHVTRPVTSHRHIFLNT